MFNMIQYVIYVDYIYVDSNSIVFSTKYKQWRSVTSATGYSIISFWVWLGVAS